MPLVRVLAEMEMNGVLIDTNALKETSVAFTERMLELERKIYEEAGEEFNISSPRQVGDILFEKLKIVEKAKKTKTGQYVTSEEVLQQLKNKAPIVSNILAYRGLKKLLGTYVDALPKLINPRTGHIHTSFNQTVTATGRLSSSDPNLQNIPVRGEDGKDIRRCFIPEPGCLFFSADYSQIELRVMAHLSNDANMIEAFREGHDIHTATAAKIYKESLDSVTRDQRTKANVPTSASSTASQCSVWRKISTLNAPKRSSLSTDILPLTRRYMSTWSSLRRWLARTATPKRSCTAAATCPTSTHTTPPCATSPSATPSTRPSRVARPTLSR